MSTPQENDDWNHPENWSPDVRAERLGDLRNMCGFSDRLRELLDLREKFLSEIVNSNGSDEYKIGVRFSVNVVDQEIERWSKDGF
jgi:hypothetical protein